MSTTNQLSSSTSHISPVNQHSSSKFSHYSPFNPEKYPAYIIGQGLRDGFDAAGKALQGGSNLAKYTVEFCSTTASKALKAYSNIFSSKKQKSQVPLAVIKKAQASQQKALEVYEPIISLRGFLPESATIGENSPIFEEDRKAEAKKAEEKEKRQAKEPIISLRGFLPESATIGGSPFFEQKYKAEEKKKKEAWFKEASKWASERRHGSELGNKKRENSREKTN